jgi:hypothetical protein
VPRDSRPGDVLPLRRLLDREVVSNLRCPCTLVQQRPYVNFMPPFFPQGKMAIHHTSCRLGSMCSITCCWSWCRRCCSSVSCGRVSEAQEAVHPPRAIATTRCGV